MGSVYAHGFEHVGKRVGTEEFFIVNEETKPSFGA